MPAPQATDTPPGELERYEVQLLLAQIHGFVHESVRRVDKWCPETAMVTRDDIREAYAEVCDCFGSAQSILNHGKYDAELLKAGLSGGQLEIKKRGWRAALRRFIQSFSKVRTNTREFLTRMKDALGWASTIVGSITTALAGNPYIEAVKEFVEVLVHTANAPIAPAPQRPPAEKGSRSKQVEFEDSEPADASARSDDPDSNPEDDVSRR
jgi:hypothetical protein